jgi:hypothetical protein
MTTYHKVLALLSEHESLCMDSEADRDELATKMVHFIEGLRHTPPEPRHIYLDREAIHQRLDMWMDEVETIAPDFENGRRMTIEFTAATHHWDRDDRCEGAIMVKTTDDGDVL